MGGRRRRRPPAASAAALLALPDLPAEVAARLVAHLRNPGDYGAEFPAPSVSMREPSFVAGPVGRILWRGPTWINTNWYLARGLRAHGEEALERHLEDRSADLIERSGFREHYDPRTGEGHGVPDFSWSALVLDMLAAREGE